ncbi:hypothetical protein ABZU76_09080 [Amycolatopsis sp. NPDC005232]
MDEFMPEPSPEVAGPPGAGPRSFALALVVVCALVFVLTVAFTVLPR